MDQLSTKDRNKELINSRKQKVIPDRHRHDLSSENVDLPASHYWLTHEDLFPETEDFICAIQDQVVLFP